MFDITSVLMRPIKSYTSEAITDFMDLALRKWILRLKPSQLYQLIASYSTHHGYDSDINR